jgi:nitrite reductase/ring-hydroxylating ferredoxin subunit
MADNWNKVGDEAQFAQGLHVVRVNGKKVVLGRLDGQLFAFDALCPHAGGPMELSECEGAIVSCPLHAWRFDLNAGGKELHGYRGLPLKKVKTEGGAVWVTE